MNISIISTTLSLHNVLRIRSAVFVPHIINIQLIILSHKSEGSDYRKELKYFYYDKVTSVNCYKYLNDSKLIKKVDNSIILIF